MLANASVSFPFIIFKGSLKDANLSFCKFFSLPIYIDNISVLFFGTTKQLFSEYSSSIPSDLLWSCCFTRHFHFFCGLLHSLSKFHNAFRYVCWWRPSPLCQLVADACSPTCDLDIKNSQPILVSRSMIRTSTIKRNPQQKVACTGSRHP